MGFFAERTRVKIDGNGLVRLSIRADQTSVDEFVFSYSEFEAVREAFENEMNIWSSNIRVKRITKGYSVQLRENTFKRKIYDFSISEFQIMMNQYRSCQTVFEKSGGMDQVGVIDPVDDIKDLSIKLEHSFERLYEEIQTAASAKRIDFDLERVVKSIDSKLTSILETTQNLKLGQVASPPPMNIPSADLDDEMFIPAKFNDTLQGSVVNEPEISEGTTADDAAEALKKLRKRGKK